MITLNYSRLNVWDICPRLYRFQYIDRIPTPPKPALFLANQVHQALQQYLSIPLAEREGINLEQLLRDNWRRHPERPRVFADREEEAEHGRRALSMLQNFLAGDDARAEPEAVEQWFEVDVTEGVRLNGKVDRIDRTAGGLVVVDYKTGRLWNREAEMEGLQPVTYTFLVQEATGEPVREVVLFFLPANERLVIRPDPGVLSEFRERLAAYARTIQAEREFAPAPSPFCSICDHRDRCPEGQAFTAEAASARDEAPELPF